MTEVSLVMHVTKQRLISCITQAFCFLFWDKPNKIR